MQLTIEDEMDNIRKGIMEYNQLSEKNSITNDKKLIELESNESYSERLSRAISYAIHNAPEDMTQEELWTIDETIQAMGADVNDPDQIRIGADLLPLIRSRVITQEETSVVFGSDKSNARMKLCAELLSVITDTRINQKPYDKMSFQDLIDIRFSNAEIKAFSEAVRDGRDPMVVAKGTEADRLYDLFISEERTALVRASLMENMTVPKFMVCVNPDFSADQIEQVEPGCEPVYAPVQKVVFGESVREIGPEVFAFCSKLTDIETSEIGHMRIGQSAFAECKGLKKVSLNNSVTSVGNFAFAECTKLEKVSLPDAIKNIYTDSGLFFHDNALRELSVAEDCDLTSEAPFPKNINGTVNAPICLKGVDNDFEKKKITYAIPDGCRVVYGKAYDREPKKPNLHDTVEAHKKLVQPAKSTGKSMIEEH